MKITYSIIIPTCDRNDLLGKCLDCLAPGIQSIDKGMYEVIVSDDSKKNEAKVFVETNYPWVKWVNGPKKGPAANRNNGVKYSQGNWLVFLDDDCLPDKDILIQYNVCINDNPKIKVFEGKIIAIGKKKSPLEYAPININGGHLWSCNFAIEAFFFKSINGFDESFKYPHMEDVDIKERIDTYNETIFFASGAIVGHPWRKLSNGNKLGMYQEMYVYYCVKNKKELKLSKLLLRIIYVHLGLFRKSFFSSDFFTAIKIMFQHLLTVIINYKKWKKIYVGKP